MVKPVLMAAEPILAWRGWSLMASHMAVYICILIKLVVTEVCAKGWWLLDNRISIQRVMHMQKHWSQPCTQGGQKKSHDYNFRACCYLDIGKGSPLNLQIAFCSVYL